MDMQGFYHAVTTTNNVTDAYGDAVATEQLLSEGGREPDKVGCQWRGVQHMLCFAHQT